MKKLLIVIVLLFPSLLTAKENVTLLDLQSKFKLDKGFVGVIYDDDNDKLYLKIHQISQEFLYQSSLPQGLGSNDIGLDRGQLSDIRLVEFQKVGNRLLLVQKNTNYRAISANKSEAQSVADAFASSILWSFPIVQKTKRWLLVDASEFILQDSHGVSRALASRGQGTFSLDKSRSAIYLKRTKSFPDNTELEASITFTSNKPGAFVQQAAINPYVVSLRMHHSFIRLPEKGYQSRQFHPKSGYWPFAFEDYAQPINQPITQRFIARHRLEKKHLEQAVSEAKKPIIYYLDSGAPEPVRTALLTGASWWNQAFESIGYKNAFQVKMLPKDADPMDVRYNVIQWVHRATRGWSYGYGVTDPRNGEIIKGHVTLGSLRVRQDYLIAQGMLSRFERNENDQELMDLALARIRQLAAHEVGHTLGLAHNFAASSYGRESVMDYPHPYFEIDQNNKAKKITSQNAYKENIGLWDKAAIAYGYQTFPAKTEQAELKRLLLDNQNKGLIFITDPDARKNSDAHPLASLWDNGSNTVDELERMINIRQIALSHFGEASLQSGRPYSDLQEILIPTYFFHRYQTTAAAKWIGGVNYQYSLKGDIKQSVVNQPVNATQQLRATEVILTTLTPDFLSLDQTIQNKLLPKAYGYSNSRESLVGHTGQVLDLNALASASIEHSLSLLLEPTRLARLLQQGSNDSQNFNIESMTRILHQQVIDKQYQGGYKSIHQSTIDLIYSHYLNLLHDKNVATQVKIAIHSAIKKEVAYWQKKSKRLKSSSGYVGFAQYQIERLTNASIKSLDKEQLIKMPKMPPGSPI